MAELHFESRMSDVTLLSDRDQVHLDINSDLAAVPDTGVLGECLQVASDEILRVA